MSDNDQDIYKNFQKSIQKTVGKKKRKVNKNSKQSSSSSQQINQISQGQFQNQFSEMNRYMSDHSSPVYFDTSFSNANTYYNNYISQMGNDELRNEINRKNERIQYLETSFNNLYFEFVKLQNFVSSMIQQPKPFNLVQNPLQSSFEKEEEEELDDENDDNNNNIDSFIFKRSD